MRFTGGCDVGSLTTKAVILADQRIVGSALIRSKARPEVSAEQVIAQALSAAKLTRGEVTGWVGTGYGREKIPGVDRVRSEIACHGRGAGWLLPSVRTVIDIGGQDCKVIKIDAAGNAVRFLTNDKCASGTGRFLEVMARVLGIEIDALGELTRKSKAPVTLTSTCTVWAQADVISQVHAGVPIEDIGAGINLAMAKRVATMANTIQPEPDICMTGGVAKNAGVVGLLEKLLGCRLRRIRRGDPQLVGAIGAALIARDRLTEELR
jgi:(R)-2-hydroxyacyl-CoA dehydratese activating ATPase